MSFENFAVTKGFLPPSYVVGQRPRPDETFATPNAGASEARAEFTRFAGMTPAERMREALLKRLGVTEADLKTMPPEERKAIEDRVRQLVEEQIRTDPKTAGRPGQLADLFA